MGIYDFTMQDVIRRNALFHANKTAFISIEGSWTFGQYTKEVDRLAAGLGALGVRKGDRIGVVAFNSYEFLLLFGAAARLGAILVPVNWRLKPNEINLIFEDSKPKIVVVSPDYMDMVENLVTRVSCVTNCLVIGKGVGNFRSFEEIMAYTGRFQEVEVTQQDPFIILYTASVDGRPKGAVLTHANLVITNFQVMALMGIKADSVFLNLLPFFHIAGILMSLQVVQAGGRNIIMKKFDAREAADWIEREQVTFMWTFPPMLSMILDEAKSSGSNLSSLRIGGGWDQQEMIQRFRQMTGAPFWVGFGQTETTGICTMSLFDEQPGSAGREVPLVRMRIVDEYDREVPEGGSGEIVVRGPVVFQKYWNKEEETTYTFRGGWHHTGDIGRLDGKGYLWYVKRKAEKELIKPGGENVYPGEVEKTLLEHPDVLEACVFGIPDDKWGEAIKAVCVLRQGTNPEPEGLIEFVASRIARYKKPKYVTFVEALPKTKDGEVDREKVKSEHGDS